MAALLDGHSYCFASVFSFDDALFQFVQPFAGVEYLADFPVLANQDAALGIFRRVACVDADAAPLLVELGAAQQKRKPLLEFRRVGDDDSVLPFWNGALALDFVGTVLVVAPSRFQSVAKIAGEGLRVIVPLSHGRGVRGEA